MLVAHLHYLYLMQLLRNTVNYVIICSQIEIPVSTLKAIPHFGLKLNLLKTL